MGIAHPTNYPAFIHAHLVAKEIAQHCIAQKHPSRCLSRNMNETLLFLNKNAVKLKPESALKLPVCNYLWKELNTLQVQLTEQKQLIAQLEERSDSQNSHTSTKPMMASEAFLQKNWKGVDKILQDHLRSISQKQDPVDFSSSNPTEIIQHFQGQLSVTDDVLYIGI